MAWIESNQELGRHPKTKKLARLLGVSLPTAVGHLQFIWWWALDFAKDGNLSKYDDAEIADAAGWDGDPIQFRQDMVEAKFFDFNKETNGPLLIHDWHEYGGKLFELRASDAERKRKSREKNGKSEEVQGTSEGHPRDGGRRLYNNTLHNQNTTTATTASAPEESEPQPEPTKSEPFAAAYVRVFKRDLTPFQAENLGKYIDDEGFEERVIVRAIERAALKSGGISLVIKILNDYAAGGAKTLQGAEAFDAEFEANKARGDPGKRPDRQSEKADHFAQLAREYENDESGSGKTF